MCYYHSRKLFAEYYIITKMLILMLIEKHWQPLPGICQWLVDPMEGHIFWGSWWCYTSGEVEEAQNEVLVICSYNQVNSSEKTITKRWNLLLNVIQLNTRECVIRFIMLLGVTIPTILILLQVTFTEIRSHSEIS